MFVFSLYHAYNIGSESNYLFMQVFYVISGVLFVIGVIYRTNYKFKQRFKGNFIIKKIVWETKDTFSIIIENVNHLKVNFKAGQFCFLRINNKKLYARHPFTISSAPNEDLRFTIKLNGRFTKIASELKNGDEIVLEGPFGIFTNNIHSKNLLFIGGGVGMTPFMSLINDIKNHKNKYNQNVDLIYCCRKEEMIIFKKELEDINENWFNKTYFLSEEKNPSNNYIIGRVSKDFLEKKIKSNQTIYICGPEPMKNAVKKYLNELGVDKSQIKTEDFFW